MKWINIHLSAAVVFAIAIPAAMISMMSPEAVQELTGFAALMMVWSVVPIVCSALVGWIVRRSKPATLVSLSGMLVVFALMAVLIVMAILQPAPQSGLIFLFAPVYAFILLVPFVLAACWIRFAPQAHG